MLKKTLFIAFTFFAGLFIVKAGPVSEQKAKTIALNFFKVTASDASRPGLTATLNYASTESDGSVDFYVFNISPATGFVIVSGSDNVMPVLAYSTEIGFTPNFRHMGVSDWVKHVSANIHTAAVNHIAVSAHVQGLWQAYLNGQNPVTAKTAVVGPLLRTTWNQEPYYNSICPLDAASNTRAVTGCVATAMAQIMKYWSYPPQGTGSYSYNDSPPQYTNTFGTQSANFGATTYNWAGMANNVTSNTSPADTLSYQCGVAVAMDYGTDAQGGSGAFVTQAEAGQGRPCAQFAYANYFSYNANTMQGVRISSYSTTDWLNLMRSELNAGRVIQYEGDDPTAGGHTWVCDGYDNTDMLHMNWGWGGSYDGYFVPTTLDADGYNFNQNDAALIGIEPLYPFNVSATTNNPTLCPGNSAVLMAQGPASATYTWSPATALSCTSCAVTNASPTSTTLYTVTIDSAGVIAHAFVTVVIAKPVVANFNFTSAATCTLPQTVVFKDTTINATSYLWSFGDGLSDTVSSPAHAYNAYGTYTVKLVGSNACYSDSITRQQVVQVLDKAPVSADQNICAGQSLTLTAVDTFGGINWFTSPSGGSSFNSGSTYVTGPLSATTIYYVEASIPSNPTMVGAIDTTIGTGSVYNHTTQRGLIFNSLESQQLTSVDVYSDSSGSRTIMLLDSAGTTINSVTLNVADGKQTVPLNFALPIENKLSLVIGGFNYLHRNLSGGAYPYTSGDGNLVITGNTSNSPTSYYYFYNWQLQPNPCVTARTVIPVFVLSSGGVSFSAGGTYSQVTFTPADTNATSYSWNFGDGSSSTLVNPVHAYSADGSYTVQLIVSNGSCTDTTTQTINTLTLGINNIPSLQSMAVYPNPAKDILTVQISSSEQMDNCSLSIHNMLGQQINQTNMELIEGVNTFNLNINNLASGIYLINLKNGEEVVTRRFVKEN